MNIESLASYLSRRAVNEATLQLSKKGKTCVSCHLIRSPRAFEKGSETCRRCSRLAERPAPSCHPMLMRKW